MIVYGYVVALLLVTAEGRVVLNPRHRTGAVVSNAPACAQIGRDIMQEGGTVIDAAIATALCEGVVNPSTTGVGGGFLATIYNRTTGEVFSFNSRESAPAAATRDMFVKNPTLSSRGGLSVAIPSEIKGYWEMYKNWGGGVSWRRLLQPTITLCEEGITMNDITFRNAVDSIEAIRMDPVLENIFIDRETKELYQVGQLYRRPQLARTLRILAKEGGNALYEGSLAEDFVNDIQEKGGIITLEDLRNYEPEKMRPVHTTILDKDLFTIPLPGSGTALIYLLNILENYLDTDDQLTTKNYQRIVESMKFAYGERSNLGDGNFVEGMEEFVEKLVSKEFAEETRSRIFDDRTFGDPAHYGSDVGSEADHGTGNVCAWGPSGDGISITSSVNNVFGARFGSETTGIILNNSMDDFSSPGVTNDYGYPPAPANFIAPGKRPLSSMCPSIILDKYGDIFMVVGGAGGSKILSSVAQVILNRLYFNLDVASASHMKRIHHQLIPMNLHMEDDWLKEDQDVVQGLIDIGHNITFSSNNGFVAVTTISVDDENPGEIVGVHDRRRKGSVAYLK
ncbi:unnamed protein product [Phyllotreta striolata]|uniref:Gamma-glutamyltranspeptidase 1 n=1 Tax=Phyllotreta striolata TaxID=444603 RepID=A0A9N9TYD4_PHYSR|nr:unnamed protein product [Phyllotreta striolata]